MRQKGIAALVVVLIVVVLAGVGAWYAFSTSQTAAPTSTNEVGVAPSLKPAANPAQVIPFTKGVYEEALASDKLVVLYFYANWCPICREEFPRFQEIISSFSADQVVALQVNFNDSETDADEEAIARKYDIPYQHSKVFLKNGEVLLKSLESWDTAQYVENINQAL